jgi:AraC family transcriptional regulator
MDARRICKNPLAEALGLPEAPLLSARKFKKSTLMVTELRSGPNLGITESLPYDDAYLVSLKLKECNDQDLFFDGKFVKPTNFFVGTISITDIRRDPIADIRSSFHSLVLYLPQKALDYITEEAGVPSISELKHEPGVGMFDPVVRNLLLSLFPTMMNLDEVNLLFVDQVALALSTHIADEYGGMPNVQSPRRGTLAPWQERRVKEILSANLNGEVPLHKLAAECGLSARHFARAFRQTTGVPPHRWLLKLRITKAKEFLLKSKLTLTNIALACGFADQSHFTRVFSANVGESPGAWRAKRLNTKPGADLGAIQHPQAVE